jgi:hypothetical protein
LSTFSPSFTEKKGRVARVISYLKAHPLLCLLILTPGIPEYLSGSSNMAFLVLNPPVFFLFLAANLALYGPGVILIREAKIRWNKGWASIFLLGGAYGIVEEGLALRTLFNPKVLGSRKPRRLRTLARSQLGLDRRASNLPFSFQHRPTNLHLWTSFPRSEVKESCFN